jgi:predicted AAA+ superfamily ATPase
MFYKDRPEYIKTLSSYIDVPVIKILVGIRRSGKSTLLRMFRDELLSRGVEEDSIIERRYSDFGLAAVDAPTMYADLSEAIGERTGRYYLLLDEVGEIEGWEQVVNTLFEGGLADIYVTGSNSKLLATEISTYLSGRTVHIPVYPLSFGEYLSFREAVPSQTDAFFAEYLRRGGFPILALHRLESEQHDQIVQGIYTTVVQQDIARRYRISNIELFDRVVLNVIENIGKTFSALSISRFLKSQGRSFSVELVYDYLSYLEQALIINRCKRYDVKGKEILRTQEKFYITDHSIRHAIVGYDPDAIASVLENIVYIELLRRGWRPFVGKFGDKEIDFIAVRGDLKCYIQICTTLPSSSNREIDNLKAIKDNYPKLVLTLDRIAVGNIEGIQIVHIIDFLLGEYA